jgi:hypothetical protein
MPAQLEQSHAGHTGARGDTKDDVDRAARRGKGNWLVAELATTPAPAARERRSNRADLQSGPRARTHHDRTVRWMQLEHKPGRHEREIREFDTRDGRWGALPASREQKCRGSRDDDRSHLPMMHRLTAGPGSIGPTKDSSFSGSFVLPTCPVKEVG